MRLARSINASPARVRDLVQRITTVHIALSSLSNFAGHLCNIKRRLFRKITMAEVDSASGRDHDALDDLFTYDTSMDDVFNTTTSATNNVTSGDSGQQNGSLNQQSANGLGIDEEIVVTKRRAPVPKLDETR